MAYGLYISAEGALAQSARMETIANNLANADTPGFKRDLALFQARYAEETQRGLDYPYSRSINDLGGGVMVQGSETDFSSGKLQRTEIPTDMAIRGEGFFVVRRDGQDLLTRAGNFRLMSTGDLVTQDGDPVLSEERTPIRIDPEQGPWQLTPEGGIAQAGVTTNLALVQPLSLGDLVKAGENLFAPLAAPRPLAPQQRQVVSGHLEQSGVQPTQAMMEMIETSRAFEANVNLIRNQDQMLGSLIGRILRT